MPTVEVSIRIAAPVEAVEAVLLDAERAPDWTTGLERLELVEGQVGQAGSVGHAHYREGDRRYVLTDVLEEARAGERYVSRVSGGGIIARVVTTLEVAADGTTLLRLRWSGRGTNPLTFVALPFMRGRVRDRALADLASLRDLVESG
jgi:hypothetical protein